MRLDAAARLAWALIALTVPGLPFAADPSAVARADPSAVAFTSDLSRLDRSPGPSAPLDLVVNGGGHETVQVVLRDGDALVAVEDLEAAGLQGFAGRREPLLGRQFVSLASLAPTVTYVVDERELALRVTARPELFRPTIGDLNPSARPPGLEVRGNATGFLNYSVQLRDDRTTSGSFEGGVSHDGKLLYSSAQLQQDGTALRGLTNLTLDDVPSLRRIVVGDAVAPATGLGGGVLLGGLSLAREWSLDPYRIRSPMPRLSGVATSPSVLDVYVNGVLQRQVPVAPGAYDFTNVPVTNGAGNVETVLRDPYGRTEVLSWQYYYTAGLLERGLSDYGYSLGFRRLNFLLPGDSYGRPLLVAHHRVGVREGLTLGGRLDAGQDLVSGGPSATVGLPFGTLDLEAAASAGEGHGGAAGSAAYSYVARRFNAGALLRVESTRYASASLHAADDRPLIQSSAFGAVTLSSRISVGASWSRLDRRDGGESDVLTARTDLQLAHGVTLGISGSRARNPGGDPSWELLANLTWAIAPLTFADVASQARPHGPGSTSAGVQRSLPAGTGFGYRARAGSDAGVETATGVLQAQWDHGRYELEYDRRGPSKSAVATIAGGAVVLGDRLYLTRPVEQGYGILRVGVPDVRGFVEGQEIGRTDAKGDLFLPRLLPYYGNRIAIATEDVPVEYQIGDQQRFAGPPFRGGVLARLDVSPLRATQGELVTTSSTGAEVPPAYGELTFPGEPAPLSSPVGKDGRFYVEGASPGEHRGQVDWSGGRCLVTIVVPESPAIADLGRVRCEPEERLPPPPPPPEPAQVGTTVEVIEIGPIVPIAPPRGFGPATERCPSCGLCASAGLHPQGTPTALQRCEHDVAAMRPGLGRDEVARECDAPDWHALCLDCLRVREERQCQPWPADAAAESSPAAASPEPVARPQQQLELERKLRDGSRFVLADVEFAGRTRVLTSDQGLVDLAGALAAVPEVNIRVEAFLDASGDPDKDAQESMGQAMAVMRRLVELGVATERIAQVAKGSAEPVAPSFTAKGRSANRRVEIVPTQVR